jgi:hypothetical protein
MVRLRTEKRSGLQPTAFTAFQCLPCAEIEPRIPHPRYAARGRGLAPILGRCLSILSSGGRLPAAVKTASSGSDFLARWRTKADSPGMTLRWSSTHTAFVRDRKQNFRGIGRTLPTLPTSWSHDLGVSPSLLNRSNPATPKCVAQLFGSRSICSGPDESNCSPPRHASWHLSAPFALRRYGHSICLAFLCLVACGRAA